jgi:hypothetical protein
LLLLRWGMAEQVDFLCILLTTSTTTHRYIQYCATSNTA